MIRFDTEPYFKRNIKFTDHTAHEVLKTKAGQSNHLHCSTLHIVVDIDVGLGGADVPVSSQAHEYPYSHAFRSQVGDESASA
jgi:hypothetical protein